MCGRPVYMSRYARLMLHSVTGSCYGRKDELQKCAETIEQLEATLCTIYAEKTGQNEEDIRTSYFDGQDHWLTAQEALDLGFIDGLYDAEPVPENSTPEQIYSIYQNRLQNNDKPKPNPMLAKLKRHAFFADCTNEADVLRQVEKLETTLQNYQRQEREAQEREIDEIIEKAFEEGRLPAPHKAAYKAMLQADRERGEAALNALPIKQRVMDYINQSGSAGNAVDRSRWTLTDYRKYAPKALQNDPALYQRLLEEERERQQQ